jgi:hypothetical protein
MKPSEEQFTMRKHLLAAGIAAITLIPTFAAAQQTCEDRRNNRVAGTVVGGVLGALAGSAVAGRGDRSGGAVIGGVGGAVIGNQLSKGSGDCQRAYGYYDSNGMWHANAASRESASGYYDGNGAWVEGRPNGYYDNRGRWVSAGASASASGYYDSDGHWVPASANGYYEADGRLVAGAASGHYENGRWVQGYATGYYDRNGRWIPGEAPGRRDASGRWVADAQPGYYDTNGRWRVGPAMGYYDGNGRWIATAPAATGYGTAASYEDRSDWRDAPQDVRSREMWLDRRIQRGRDNGALSRREARNASMTLEDIRRDHRMMMRDGRLSGREESTLMARLDDLNGQIRWNRRD